MIIFTSEYKNHLFNVFDLLFQIRESARSTESNETSFNKSPSRCLTSADMQMKNMNQSMAIKNASIRQYLQEHHTEQLRQHNSNKSPSTLSITQTQNPYQQGQDFDENRLIIEEDDDPDRATEMNQKDIITEEKGTKLVIVGTGNSLNINPAIYGESLDLSKGRGSQLRLGGEEGDRGICVLGREADITSNATNISQITMTNRLSNASTVKLSTLATNPISPSLSSNVTPTTGRSIMTLIPYSKTTSSENIPISISNSSTVNIANLQSSVTPHLNLKGNTFEGGKHSFFDNSNCCEPR